MLVVPNISYIHMFEEDVVLKMVAESLPFTKERYTSNKASLVSTNPETFIHIY
jgi:hypothetical protein